MQRYQIRCLECGKDIAVVESINPMCAFTDFCSEIGWNPLHFATQEGICAGIAIEGTVTVSVEGAD